MPGRGRDAGSSCIREPRHSASRAGRWQEVFALAESAKVPILIHAGRGLPPLAEGLADLALRYPGAALILAHGAICDQGILTIAPGRPPGRAVRHLLLLPPGRDRAVRAGPGGADRVRLGSAVWPAGDDPLHGAAGGAAGGLDERTTRLMLGGTMAACSTAASCRRDERRAAGPPRSPSPGASRGCTDTRAWWGRRCSRGPWSSARAMLEMAIASCRDPEPGEVGEALETIGARSGGR